MAIRTKADVKRKSKEGNKACPCGSDKKFKKCCGKPVSESKTEDELKKWEMEWT